MANELIDFEQWMREVNRILRALCGMTADDLPDYCYWDSFTSKVSPKTTAKRAIRYAEGF